MKLQYKAIILFVGFLACLLVLNLFQWSMQSKNRVSARDATAHFVEASFQGKIDEFRDSMIAAGSRISHAYSYERLSSFLPKGAIEVASIDSYLEGAKLDFMFFMDAEGNLVFGREYNYYRDVSSSLNRSDEVLVWEVYQQVLRKGSLNFGVLYVGPDPIYVAVNTITDESSGANGYVVVGSYLNTMLSHIEGTLNLDINYVVNGEAIDLTSEELVRASLETLLGNPVALTLRIENEAAITPSSVNPQWGLWLGLAIVISLAFWRFIYRPIFGEMNRIMEQLNAIQMSRRYSDRLDVVGEVEFSQLSARVNAILSTLEYAYNLLVKNSEVTSNLIVEVENHRDLESKRMHEEVDSDQLPVNAEERMHMVSRLSRAIERKEIRVAFQAQYETIGQDISSVTALARWDDEELGRVPPDQFISLAEDASLTGPLGEVLIKEACMKAKSWQNAGYKPIPVACKLSSTQFNDKRLLAIVAASLATSKLEPRYLELEIKEQVLMKNVTKSIEILTTLGHIGVQLVIDDYVGQGGMKHLVSLPVNKIKLDPSLIADVADNKKDASLIEGVVKLGNSLGLVVIAAGVETEGQLKALRSNNGNVGLQGFYLGRPMSSAEIVPLLSLIEVARLSMVK